MERKEYQLTDEQLNRLYDAAKPVPAIMLHLGSPASPQERSNNVWREIGRELGFDYMTARPCGKGDKFFTAVPLPQEVKDVED